MPPRPPLANTVKIELNWAGPNATKATNIMYALMGTGWSPNATSLGEVASNYWTAIGTGGNPIQGVVSEDWSTVSVTAIDNSGATEIAVVSDHSSPGTIAQSPLSPNCAQVLSWTINAHYRGGHPRMYIPGVATTSVTEAGSNELTSTIRSAISAFGSAFLTAFNDALAGSIAEALGTIAYHRNNVPLATPVFYPYTGGEVHGRLDSQRRRLGKESLFP